MSALFDQLMAGAVAKTRPGNAECGMRNAEGKKATIRIELPHLKAPEQPRRGPTGPFLTAAKGAEPWQIVFNSADSMIGVLGSYLRRIESGAVKPTEMECTHVAGSMEHLSKCALQLAELLDKKRGAA